MKVFCFVLLVSSLLQMACSSYVKFEDTSGTFVVSNSRRISKRHTQSSAPLDLESHGKSAAGTPHLNSISDVEDKDSEEIGTDYDFVLNLDEKEDFDRLLTLLSRSGPAKHSDEAHVGVSSTFIDRHDELHEDFPRPENSVFDQIAAERPEHTSHDESPEVEDPEKIRMDAEQKKLEELYFKNFEMDEQPRGKRMGAIISSSSIPTASFSVALPAIVVFFKYFVLITRL